MSTKRVNLSSGAWIGFRLADARFSLSDSATASDEIDIQVRKPLPAIVLGAIVERLDKSQDGNLIQSIAPAWESIGRLLRQSPNDIYSLTAEQWEEIIAASYDQAGFDEVILTPRSGDFGRDVIAVKHGFGSVRIIDQVKAYKPGHVVTANDARALLGVLHSDHAATKAILTTTSTFAPRLRDDPLIAPHVPFRLELIDRGHLVERLTKLTEKDAGT